MSSTIFAHSTPLGKSALCIFRISGTQALRVKPLAIGIIFYSKVAKHLTGVNLGQFPNTFRRVALKQDRKVIDSGLAYFFKGPKSATGEDVVEFNLHGSLAVISGVRETLLSLSRQFDLREAEKGEFTKRALLNGKMNLSEVEGLADLLDAETSFQLDVCNSRLAGRLGEQVQTYERAFIDLISVLEAKIEFDQTEALSIFHKSRETIDALAAEMKEHIHASRCYPRLKSGFEVLLLGPPNSGKSSLMNCLSGSKVSIVSDVAGTTRDLVRYDSVIDGLPIRLIDSAGVRNSSCPIEKLGVEASLEQMKSADAILLLWGEDWKQFPKELLQLDFSKTIFIHSKSDLRTQRRADCYNQDLGVEMLDVSSVTQSGISTLQDRLVQLLSKRLGLSGLASKLVLNSRQAESLQRCLGWLTQASDSFDEIMQVEFLKAAMLELKTLKGEIFNIDKIYDRIFSTFCVGK